MPSSQSIEWRVTLGGDSCFAGERVFDNEEDALERARTHAAIGAQIDCREVGPWRKIHQSEFPGVR